MDRQRTEGIKAEIPVIIESFLQHIETAGMNFKGVFRLGGNIEKIADMKKIIDKFPEFLFFHVIF